MRPHLTRLDCLEIARRNHVAYRAAEIAHLFKGGPAFDAFETFGRRHGWYHVEDGSGAVQCFSEADITGEQYDHAQGGWAHV